MSQFNNFLFVKVNKFLYGQLFVIFQRIYHFKRPITMLDFQAGGLLVPVTARAGHQGHSSAEQMEGRMRMPLPALV